MQFLLKQGAYINICDKCRKFSLNEASEKAYKTTVHLLLRYEANTNSCNRIQ